MDSVLIFFIIIIILHSLKIFLACNREALSLWPCLWVYLKETKKKGQR